MEAILSFDFGILDFIRENLTSPFLDRLMPIVSLFGDFGIFFIALSIIMLLRPKWRKTGMSAGLALALGLLFTNGILKPLVARPRPYELREIELVVSKMWDYSFPSGHATASFEFATAVIMRNRKAGVGFMILAAIVSYSRMYLYLHYPTDIIGGMLVGIIMGILATVIINLIMKKQSKMKEISE